MAPGVFVCESVSRLQALLKSHNLIISLLGEMPFWILQYRTGRHFGSNILIAQMRIKI